MIPANRETIARARAGLWAGMSAEQVLLELLDAAEEALGPVDAGQEETMIQCVTLLGLVLPGEDVPVQGPEGPVVVSGEPAAPLALYRIDGWEPDPEGGPYGPDEAQGHRVIRLMEEVGSALANDRIDAPDVARLALALQLPGGRVIQVLVPVAEQVLRALEDDGRIDAQEAMSIAGSIISAVLTLRA